MTAFVSGPASNGRFNDLSLAVWLRPPAATPTPIGFTISPNADLRIEYTGSDFTFDANGNVTGGTVTSILVFSAGVSVVDLSGLRLPVATLRTFTQNDDTPAFLSAILAGDDNISVAGVVGLEGPNLLNGFGGNDAIRGAGGDDTLRGGAGNDTLTAGVGVDSLIGGVGNDVYVVSTADDILDETDGNGTDTVIVEGTEFSLFTNGRGNIENIEITTFGLSVVSGNDLNNKITGNGSQNSIFGFGGNDTIDGGGGADTLNGGIGADKLIGGDGKDDLFGSIGRDTLLGGAGDDSYSIDDEDTATESLGGTIGGIDSLRYNGTKGGFTLGANFENLVLGSGVTGTGNALDNRITGNGLDNKLFGMAGSDTLEGEGGADTLDGGTGEDSLLGGAGADTYIVDSMFDFVEEAAGNSEIDIVRSSVSFSLAFAAGQAIGEVEAAILTGTAKIDASGNALANTLVGNAAANLISGLDGDDTLNGGGGADTLLGGVGNDTYILASKSVQLQDFGGDLGDTVIAGFSVDLNAIPFTQIEFVRLTGSAALNVTGNAERNDLVGNAGANKLLGGGADDTLDGGAGNDTLDGGTGNDDLFGGSGNDTYVFDSDFDSIRGEVAGGGIDTILSSAVDTTLVAEVEHLTLLAGGANARGNDANNRITGNDLDNILIGSGGNDTLMGGGGADMLDGGPLGKDIMNGGLGNDTYGADDGDTVTESVGGTAGGTDTVIYVGSKGHVLGANVENLILASINGAIAGTGNELGNTITGNEFNNRLLGMAGNDTLSSGGGSGNTLDGGAGADSLIGSNDFDIFVVDNALDVIDESLGGVFRDAVHSSISFDLTENGTTVIGRLEDLVLTGSKAINGTGNFLRNTITGNAAANVIDGGDAIDILFGGGGNDSLIGGADTNGDILDGGAGADTMDGGEGNDFYTVDNVKDLVIEHDGLAGGLDFVTATVSYALNGEIENLVLAGKAANGTGNFLDNRVDGNQANNILRGLEGNDILVSVGGNDTLNGGIGNDTMFGGTGNDTYFVDAFDDAVDEASGGGIDTVIASATYTLSNLAAADIENLMLAANAGNIDGRGNDRDNRITGNDGKNALAGFSGNDTISGGGHDDDLLGGEGNDSLSGGNDIDRLFGEAGDDTLNGGGGRDFYFYQSILDGHDLIVGFDGNPAGDQDFLNLDALFDSLGVATANRAARVQVTDRGSAVDLRIDTNNDGTFDLFAATLQTADTVTVGTDVVVGTL